jgi:hypothetical protein
VEQVEHWSLNKNIKLPELSDDAIDQAILPLLKGENQYSPLKLDPKPRGVVCAQHYSKFTEES